MTIVDVMISSVLTVIVLLSLTAYFNFLTKFQVRTMQNQVMEDMHSTIFQTVIGEDTANAVNSAWKNMVNDTDGDNQMACLRYDNDANDCSDESAAAEGTLKIFLRSQTNWLIYDPWNHKNAGVGGGGNGLTYTGKKCTGYVQFPTEPGNDQCPYFIDLYWRPYCVSASKPCNYPLIKVVANFEHHPKSTDHNRPFSGAYNRLVMYRNTADIQKFETIYIDDTRPASIAGGMCTVGANARMLDWTTRSDPGLNMTDTGAASGEITLKKGIYECELSAQAFGVESHQVRLLNVSAGTYLMIGTSEKSGLASTYGGQSPSVAYGTLNLTADTEVRVVHFTQTCGNVWDLGRATLTVGGTDGEVYTQFHCTKMQ